MIPTYENYLKEKNSLTFDKMQKIHTDMISEIGTDGDALELYGELISMSVKYAGIRARWTSLPKQDKMDQDASRTACHDSVIVKFNKLAKYLKMTGKEAAWRETLGEDRKRIGDFACYLVFVESLYAR